MSTNNISGYLANSLNSKGQLLAILKARQSCILPALIKSSIDEIDDDTDLENDENEDTDLEEDDEDDEATNECVDSYNEGASYSSKLDAVIDRILERKDNGNGKIIFCHFKDEIDFVAQKLKQGGLKKVITYDGRNSKSGIKTLSEKADAIVIQIQTGCEGLNLQKNLKVSNRD